MMQAVVQVGGEARFTLVPGVNHTVTPDAVYGDGAVYAWLLQHSRSLRGR
jgi:hypothetical protein